jgi:hypothetical protein
VIGEPITVLARDGYLWALDRSGDPFLHVIDLATGQRIVSFGRQGEGPGEFEFPVGLFPAPTLTSGVTVYDGQQRRFTEVALDSGGALHIGKVSSLSRAPIPLQVGRVGNHYIGWLRDPDRRWSRFGLNDSEPSTVTGPLVGPEAAPLTERIKASANVTVCARPDGGGFAALYGSAGRIELHDSMAAYLGLVAVPDSTNGEFVAEPGGRLRWDRKRFFYAGCAATNRFLFALFSGRVEGISGKSLYAGDRVQIFDWQGVQRGELRLSTDVVDITVDSIGAMLYGPGSQGGVIYRFDIPAEFAGAGQ